MRRTASGSTSAVAEAPARRRETRRKIDDEHEKLRQILGALTRAQRLERTEEVLGELAELLVVHFAGEESSEGVHEIVAAYASHRLPDLQHLFDEHRELLALTERLRADVAACLAGPVRELRDGVTHLATRLREHEAVEDELFAEAFYLDIGGRA
jgi:hemerythrin